MITDNSFSMDHANGTAKKSGWPKGRLAHEHGTKVGQAWGRSRTKARYRACDLMSFDEIWVNELGEALCNECFEVAYHDHRGFQACRCTVWNDGQPRPVRYHYNMLREWASFGASIAYSV